MLPTLKSMPEPSRPLKPLETASQVRTPIPQRQSAPSPAPAESDSDDPSIEIAPGTVCRRRGCNVTFTSESSRDDEICVYHPGHPLFHEGSKGYTCCNRRVLEFDEFMRIEGCQAKKRHMFIGSGKKKKQETHGGEEVVETVRFVDSLVIDSNNLLRLTFGRNDFYQTALTVIVSFYLKKIDPAKAVVRFSNPLDIQLDLATTDKKRYKAEIPLYRPIDTEKSTFKIMGTKLEMCLVKADGSGWPQLRSDEKESGAIIQVGQAARA